MCNFEQKLYNMKYMYVQFYTETEQNIKYVQFCTESVQHMKLKNMKSV